MMQQQQSAIDKIFAYDNATIKAKYDVQNERQRGDRLRQELTILKRKENQRQRRPTISDTTSTGTSSADTTSNITIQKLQQEKEDLHRKLHDITTQLQTSLVTVTLEQSPVSTTSNLFLEEETRQQQQQKTLEISLQEYKNYSKELEHRIEEQMTQHTNTVEVLQQQISILQDSLQTTRQRLMTREADIDRLSTELEQNKKRYLPLLPVQALPHHHHHHEFPISPLSMTDSIVDGGDGRRHRHNFDTTTTTTFTTPHTDTIITIPQQHDNINNINNSEDRQVVAITAPSTTTTTAVHERTGDLGSGQSVASSTATTATHQKCNKYSSKSITSTTSSTSYHRKPPPQIRSDLDRAKAMEKLECDRIHNTMLVQQLRQSVLLQQQQQQQQQSKN